MPVNRSLFAANYQVYYPQEEIPYQIPKTLPLLNYIMGGSTDGNISGIYVELPWGVSPAAGISQDFNTAQQQSSYAPVALIPRINLSQVYKTFDFDDKSQLLSKGEASYGNLMETTVKGARDAMFSHLDQLCHNGGNGVRALVAAVSTGTTITLDTQSAETIFEINQGIQITTTVPTDGSAPVLNPAGPFRIVAVGQNSITLNTAVTVAVGNGVANLGDTMGFSSALANPAVIGMDAYNPLVGPAPGESFLQVDRSIYGNRLAGYRLPQTTPRSIEATVKRLAVLMAQGGISAEGATVMMHPVDLDGLENKMASFQRWSSAQLGVYGFDSIAISSALGRLDVVMDPHQKQGQFRIYVPGGLKLFYRENLPHVVSLTSGETEEFGTAFDGRSQRLRMYPQLGCVQPWRHGVGQLPTIQ